MNYPAKSRTFLSPPSEAQLHFRPTNTKSLGHVRLEARNTDCDFRVEIVLAVSKV